MSMCFVLSWNTGFLAMCIALILSQCRRTGFKEVSCSSSNSLTSQVTSLAADAIALYSASLDDLETVSCFLDFQLIGEEPNNNMYPVIDLLLFGHEAQSESEYACSCSWSEPLMMMPWLDVVCTTRKLVFSNKF